MAAPGKTTSGVPTAEMIREACIQAAIEGYQSASMSGLCAEGAFESAISAIRMLDLDKLENIGIEAGD